MYTDIKKECCGCNACVNICEKQCIRMIVDEEGFAYPQIDTDKCVDCGKCKVVCPVDVNQDSHYSEPHFDAYVAYNKEKNIRQSSSSGGVFYALAEKIISEKGIVYGAAMTADCKHVQHISVSQEQELAHLQGSKYVQSGIGKVYKTIKGELKDGKKVFFTGTPCQIEGLKAFLGKDYENLICMDIICHGVPSQRVWREYLEEIENKAGAATRNVEFRNKKYGWRMYSLLIEFENGQTYRNVLKNDLFGQAFLQNLCLRPICHDCPFKKVNRVSDITIGDCWNVRNVIKDDDKGLSLILIHSQKGRQLFEAVKETLTSVEIPSESVIKDNTPLYMSAISHPQREEFFSEVGLIPIKKLLKKYVGNKKTLKWKLRILKKSLENKR